METLGQDAQPDPVGILEQLDAPDFDAHVSSELVRTACDAFTDALDVAQSMIDADREIVRRFKVSGTFQVDAGSRARLDALDSDGAAFAAIDRLDAIVRGDDPR
jgi:hypothetical protein